MKVHRIIPVSRVNGPGARFTLWVQGCSRGCPGCFNPLTHGDGGTDMTAEAIIRKIPAGDVTGITVSGGEPFEQPGELALLLEAAGKKGLHRLVYTGFTYEELTAMENEAITGALKFTDILIDGPYREDIPPASPWTGSGNQRILELENGAIRSVLSDTAESPGDGEIIITETGAVIATGIFNSAEITQ
ncbi:4Fe-4S single cluster domain-containing protein [Breznakiella homolactica]|uniref:Radical SAM protein n=1 Tax=Breznakiella homolactica TaxID=2798577 RepID=A0A7T8B8V9_9SPIR|nr:4Fe-4S single cluster domain-containing protein [Breznakiella homolactica]QQO09019.1 radical SAM protein [Breznakiella homolactica]